MVSFKWDENRAREIAREEGIEEGMEKATKNTITRIVLNLFKKHQTVTDIAETADISAEEVRKILRDNGFAV